MASVEQGSPNKAVVKQSPLSCYTNTALFYCVRLTKKATKQSHGWTNLLWRSDRVAKQEGSVESDGEFPHWSVNFC